MNKRRLLKMADFVETIPPEQFDMHVFGSGGSCGTQGCAIGWAAHKRLFHGLRVTSQWNWRPQYFGVAGFNAIATLFSISIEHTDRLFGGHPHRSTPTQVAKNLRRYVETGELP